MKKQIYLMALLVLLGHYAIDLNARGLNARGLNARGLNARGLNARSLNARGLNSGATILGELRQWHKLTLDFTGPEVSENDQFNPFLNYRLEVTFSHKASGKEYLVPGFFAADGDAANSSADKGNVWRVHFAPDETGTWKYTVSFRKGEGVAVTREEGLSGGYMDGSKGKFKIGPTDKTGRDFRARGRLEYVGERYLRFAGTGEYFLKCGADAPENLLAYADFDGPFATDGEKDDLVKDWGPHVKDWKDGDPSWNDGKGKGLVGALNYLASKGMNAFSFLTLNIIGDDRNVFPYTDYTERCRMDVSRLAQWEVLFEHGQQNGLFLHFKLSEAENQNLLDDGDTGEQRKLYYRELIARFGHHLALNWNLGEENGVWGKVKGQNTGQRRAMARYIHETDPYHHHLVVHNGQWYDDLVGEQSKLTGASLQTNMPDFSRVHDQTLRLIREAQEAGKTWAVACDEPGDATHSLVPDKDNPNHDNARKNALWGHLMAGGWGIEWYFGYAHDHSDLTCQDWRSRDRMWDQSRYALEFFRNFRVPFWAMDPADELSHSGDWVLASKKGEEPYYLVLFMKEGGETLFDLPAGSYKYGWFNPHTGVGLSGLVHPGHVDGGKQVQLEAPDSRDWVLLVGPADGLIPTDRTLAPDAIELFSFYDFKITEKPGYVPGYLDKGNRALAINAASYRDQFAAGEAAFPGPDGTYDVVITTMTETDGESSYRLLVNGRLTGEFQNPSTTEDYQLAQHRWENVSLQEGDEILVAYNSHSNGKIPEGEAFAYSRGRWRSMAFVKPGKDYNPRVDLDWSEALPERDMSYFSFDFDPVAAEKVFEEKEGLLVVEAEHFAKQVSGNVRKWYRMDAGQTPDVQPDHDGNHFEGASGKAYLEVLPDTRRRREDPLVQQENFTEDPGLMAVLYYPVWFNTPGKYYVWVRSCPTGSEDNSLHVGIDGIWPGNGQRMQWISKKSQWQWDSKQRTELVHTGVKYLIYLEVKEPGLHTIMFSMREDGFEMDKWLMSTDKDVLVHGDTGLGPDESPVRTQ